MKYSSEGLYIKKEKDHYLIGLSDKGQDDVGDVSFADLSQATEVNKGDFLISVEGDKAVSDFSFPLSGRVLAYHEALLDQADLLNADTSEDNWIVSLSATDPAEFDQLDDHSGFHA